MGVFLLVLIGGWGNKTICPWIFVPWATPQERQTCNEKNAINWAKDWQQVGSISNWGTMIIRGSTTLIGTISFWQVIIIHWHCYMWCGVHPT